MENVEDKIKSIIDELKPFLISDGEVPEVKEVRNVN